MKEAYDIVIIGSGLGGLVSANFLAKEGYSVCVLEKNKQHGGNLQIFIRNKTIFDTGVHYIGGLDKGQTLYKIYMLSHTLLYNAEMIKSLSETCQLGQRKKLLFI